MKYTIEGYSQARLVELGLDNTDALILRWFSDFFLGGMDKRDIDGKQYGWVSYSKVMEELPCCGLTKPASVARRMKKLVDAGVLVASFQKGPGWTKAWYAFCEETYYTLIGNGVTPTSKEACHPHEKVRNPSTIDSSTKKEREPRTSARHPTLDVPMNQKRYSTLITEFGQEKVDEYIQIVKDYASSKGRRYADYAAAAANFMRRDGLKPREAPKRCKNGHELIVGLTYCPTCGVDND